MPPWEIDRTNDISSVQGQLWIPSNVDFSNPHEDEPPQLLLDAADANVNSTCDYVNDPADDDPIESDIPTETITQLQQNEGAHDDTMPNEEEKLEANNTLKLNEEEELEKKLRSE